MGCPDTVSVPCPKCSLLAEFQSKSGPCRLGLYSLDNCPANVILDINRHAPVTCEKCGTKFFVSYEIHEHNIGERVVKNIKIMESNV